MEKSVQVPGSLMRCLTNDELHLILMPTEACNFRCTYCYEDFRHSRMAPDVVRGVKNLVSSRAPDLRKLRLEWFGGEPLLADDIIEDILESLHPLLDSHSHMQFESDMTTNGWLLSRERFIRLFALGVTRYQVTFDGPRGWHDRKRLRASGAGSFDRVWGNLLALRELSERFSMLVRLHVDRENYRSLPQFIRDYARAFGGDYRFTLFFKLVGRLGGPRDADLPVFDPSAGEAVVEGLVRAAAARGVRRVTLRDFEPVCYASRSNSYVVRADGRLNKCTVSLDHPNNQIGYLDEDGRVRVDPSLLKGWMRGVMQNDADVLSCPMRGYADPESGTNARIASFP
jgi:uncharacterized protein